MKYSIQHAIYWLLIGPVLALLISFPSRLGYEYFSPDKLSGIPEMITVYPLGLILSFLTPWGWLMYGGYLLMRSGKMKAGAWCSVGGALILGVFWPVWATFLNQ